MSPWDTCSRFSYSSRPLLTGSLPGAACAGRRVSPPQMPPLDSGRGSQTPGVACWLHPVPGGLSPRPRLARPSGQLVLVGPAWRWACWDIGSRTGNHSGRRREPDLLRAKAGEAERGAWGTPGWTTPPPTLPLRCSCCENTYRGKGGRPGFKRRRSVGCAPRCGGLSAVRQALHPD